MMDEAEMVSQAIDRAGRVLSLTDTQRTIALCFLCGVDPEAIDAAMGYLTASGAL